MFDGKRNRVGVVLILAAFLCLNSCNKKETIGWATYTSQDKLFKIQYPPDWKVSLDGHTFNITPPPDGTGLVAVSGYVDPGTTFNEKAFKDMVMLDFVECHVKEPFKPVTGNGWVGEDAVYERTINGQKFTYLFRVAHRGQVGVFVAVSEIEAHLQPRLPNYKQIMDSLIILDAPNKTVDLSRSKPKEVKNKPWQEKLIDWIRSTEKKEDEKSYYSY
jgi:hypothetical protein